MQICKSHCFYYNLSIFTLFLLLLDTFCQWTDERKLLLKIYVFKKFSYFHYENFIHYSDYVYLR